MPDLFSQLYAEEELARQPLAARMRPQNLAEFIGQEAIVGPTTVLRRAIERDKLPSIILWGPPGCGKTTLAEIIAQTSRAHFTPLSAVSAGVADLRLVVKEAKTRLNATGQRTVMFIDEIHRFNKSQQDAILPHVENGTVTLIGATTENPSFEVNNALLSRARVFVLHQLTDENIGQIIDHALSDPKRGLGQLKVHLEPEARAHLLNLANGDARTALNALELAVQTAEVTENGTRRVDLSGVEQALQQRALLYDREGEAHYDIISALHKSMRGSDPDASLYWLARMLESGEDPMYVVRRVVRFASEDIGMADPQALVIAMAAQQALHFIGMPEGALALAQAVVHCAVAPKSNALYTAYKAVQQDVANTRNDPVPLHLRNAPTGLMKKLGYGQGYKYAHDYEGGFVVQQNLPEALQGKAYYKPTTQGREAKIQEKLNDLRERTARELAQDKDNREK